MLDTDSQNALNMASLRTASVFVLSLFSLLTPSFANNIPEVVVRKGQSIQAAINAAQPYTKIIVERGIYKEQLVITKSGIEIFGKPLARLYPPDVYTNNACTGIAGYVTDENGVPLPGNTPTQNGICIIGDVTFGPFERDHLTAQTDKTTRYVKDVKISGLEVKGFSGINIVVVGAEDALVEKNRLLGGKRYGFLTLGSKNTKLQKNGIIGTGISALSYIGACNDDVSNAMIWNNEVEGYIIGLCVQTNGADIRGNHVSETCFGAFVDPEVDGALIRWNHIRNSNLPCGYYPGLAPVGINVAGAFNTEVRWNHVQNITAFRAPGVKGIGIRVIDFEGAARGNTVRDNYLKLNDLDIQNVATGAGNVVKNNQCTTSDPVGYCKVAPA
jgi:hypothetical protein